MIILLNRILDLCFLDSSGNIGTTRVAYLYSKYFILLFCFHLFVDQPKCKIHYKITKQNTKSPPLNIYLPLSWHQVVYSFIFVFIIHQSTLIFKASCQEKKCKQLLLRKEPQNFKLYFEYSNVILASPKISDNVIIAVYIFSLD